MWIKTATVSIQENIKKRHLQYYLMYFQIQMEFLERYNDCHARKCIEYLSVKWQSFCMNHNMLLVSSDCVWDKIAAMFQTELWKKIQKFYKRKSIWKRQ